MLLVLYLCFVLSFSYFSSFVFYYLLVFVLLILAGISISALTGSGLFEKAEDAVNRYGNAQDEENSILGEYENYIDNLGNGGNGGSLPSTGETTPYMPDSNSKVIENSDLSTGLVVADKNNNEWVWIVVPKSVTKEATTDAEIETALQTYAGVYRNGSASQNFNWTDEWYDENGKTYAETSNENDRSGCGLTYTEYDEAKSKMLQSIKANGGFWISRYEAGIEGSIQNPSIARIGAGELTASSPKAVSRPDHISYNYVKCSQAQSLASNMSPNSTKTSSLLFGIQWDLVCKYLEGKDGLTQEMINDDSTSWGNYNNNSLNITSEKAMQSTDYGKSWSEIAKGANSSSTLLTTGASTGTKKMNIYDFAGNEFEWTLEYTSSGFPCAIRGGSYNFTGSDYPASSRYIDNPFNSRATIGLRVSLY